MKIKKIIKSIIKKLAIISFVIVALNVAQASQIFAANEEPLTVINNLSDFIFGLIRAVGLSSNWVIIKKSRSKSKSKWFFNISRRSGYYICQRNTRYNYRWLITERSRLLIVTYFFFYKREEKI